MANINFNLSYYVDSAAVLATVNPVLTQGRIGVETDTGLFKIGDGVSSWNSLNYVIINGKQSVFIGISETAGNLLSFGDDGGLNVPQGLFPVYQDLVDGLLEDKVSNPNTVEGETANIHAYRQLVILVGKIIACLGSSYTVLRTPGGGGGLVSLETLLTNSIKDKVTISDVINDSTTSLNSTWSSQEINNFILSSTTTAISNVVGNAPEALDTIYEIAARMQADGNTLEYLLTAVGGAVRFDKEMTLTSPQKAQARTNIDALSASAFGTDIDTITDSTFTDLFDQAFNTATSVVAVIRPAVC